MPDSERVIARSWRNVISRRAVFHRVVASTWLILIYLVMQGSRNDTVSLHFTSLTPLNYFRTQAGIILHYLRLAIWPHPLVLDYYNWPIARSWTLLNALILTAFALLSAVSIMKAVKGSRIGFLGTWFFLTLTPTSSIIPIISEIADERRMYLPLIAVVIILAQIFHSFLARFARISPIRFHSIERSFMIVICILLGITSWQRNSVYRSARAVWQDTVDKRPDNSRAHANLGTEYLRAGDQDRAVSHFRKALDLDPKTAALNLPDITGSSHEHPLPAHSVSEPCPPLQVSSIKSIENLGLLYLERGEPEQALAYLQISARCRPDDAVTRINLANAAIQAGDADLARSALTQAVHMAPDNATARIRLAQLLADSDDPIDSIREAQQAMALDPRNPDIRNIAAAVHLVVGRRLATDGRDADAKTAFVTALELKPGWGDAGNSVAMLLARSTDTSVRDPARAIALAENAEH